MILRNRYHLSITYIICTLVYISKIHIKNYRGIVEQELIFTKYNTLIGRNDCGKSTIINAIKLFFSEEKATKKDFNYYQEKNRDISITVTLADFSSPELKQFLVQGEKDDGFAEVVQDYCINGEVTLRKVYKDNGMDSISAETAIEVCSFKNYPIYTYKKVTEITSWIKSLGVIVPQDGTGNNSIIEKQKYIREKLLELNEERELIYRSIKFVDIKNALPAVECVKADQSIDTTTTEFKGTFSSEVRSIIKSETESGERSTLAAIESKISTRIQEETEAIKLCMSEHISDLEKLIITPSFSWEKGVEITNVDIQLKGDKKPIPLENKGAGYRRLFMVGRLRYLAEKKRSENVIYLVEEPETFLHPSAQDEMLQSLLSLSESNQIFVTTHSPIFLGATKLNAITLCKKEETELHYKQNHDEDFLIGIAQEIGVKPSHNILDTYEKIIFVEGSNDREYWRIVSKKLGYNLHTMEDTKKIAIFDGGGESLSNFIDIMYFESLGKTMFLIIDSDKYDPTQITNPDKQKSLDEKQARNMALQLKFNAKTAAKTFILNKKSIDTYYHPKAIERKTGLTLSIGSKLFPDTFCTETFLKNLKKDNPSLNICKKNWLEVFEEMTPAEWAEVSNGELESILEAVTA